MNCLLAREVVVSLHRPISYSVLQFCAKIYFGTLCKSAAGGKTRAITSARYSSVERAEYLSEAR